MIELVCSTKASGKFDIFLVNENKEPIYHSSSPNIITNFGLDSVASVPWEQNFQAVHVGTGTNAAQTTDQYLQTWVLSSSNLSPNLDSGVTAVYDNGTGSTTYSLTRSFFVTNTSGSTRNITEVGLSRTDEPRLFNRTVLASPLNNWIAGAGAIFRYTLQLTTTGTAQTSMALFKDGSSYRGPFNAGVVSMPFRGINTNGTSNSHAYEIFEPSTTCKLHGLYSTQSSATADYASKRTVFTTTPTTIEQSNQALGYFGTRSGNYGSYVYAMGDVLKLGDLANPVYVSGSYSRQKTLLTTTFGSNVDLYGMGLTTLSDGQFNATMTTGLGDYGNPGRVPPSVGGKSRANAGWQWMFNTTAAPVLGTDSLRFVERLTWNRV